jgi:hypothetical protein
VLLAVVLLAPVWAKDGVKLEFAPRAPLTATETIRETTVREMVAPGMKAPLRDTFVTEKRVRYAIRPSVKGFTVSETLLSVRVRHDGAADDPDPFDRCLLNNPITFSLDKSGKLLRVLGAEKVVETGRDVLSAEERDELGGMLDAATLTKSFASDWDVAVGALVGRMVKSGATWSQKGDTFLPDGTLGRYTESVKVGDTVTVGESTGVTLAFTNDVDKKAFARALSTVFNRGVDGDEEIPWKVLEATQKGERVVDTSLLLDLRARQTTVTRAEATAPNGAKFRLSLTSTAESTLVFGDAPDPNVWRAPSTAT